MGNLLKNIMYLFRKNKVTEELYAAKKTIVELREINQRQEDENAAQRCDAAITSSKLCAFEEACHTLTKENVGLNQRCASMERSQADYDHMVKENARKDRVNAELQSKLNKDDSYMEGIHTMVNFAIEMGYGYPSNCNTMGQLMYIFVMKGSEHGLYTLDYLSDEQRMKLNSLGMKEDNFSLNSLVSVNGNHEVNIHSGHGR